MLAGERPEGDMLARQLGVPAKALSPICGEPMVNHVLRSLLDAAEVGRIVILAQDMDRLRTPKTEWIWHEKRIAFRDSGGSISQSIASIAGSAEVPWPILVTTADHPLLTPEMVSEFLAEASRSDVTVGMVKQETVMGAYPDTRRTWLHFEDGAFSGANLFALSSARVEPALALWAEAERDRKKAFRLFWHFGPRLAFRAITRTISFDDALEQAGRNIGLTAHLALLSEPEAAVDVDKVSDLNLVERIMRRAVYQDDGAVGRRSEVDHISA
nr:NTP transferase domain-containing protein [Altericroceibacterium spongiae]